jgi:hypothetical protein
LPPWVDRFVLVFVRESTLWPVLLVLIGHAAAFLGMAMLLGLRDGRIPSLLLLALLAVASLRASAVEFGARRRPGALTGLIGSVWLASAGLAWLAHHYGVF